MTTSAPPIAADDGLERGRRVPAQWQGLHDRVREPVTAVVVGGGLAGVAAATVLAERGVRVTLLECENTLGGRLRSWTERLPDGTELRMERGFHAFFRQYYNVRRLLRRVDPSLERLMRLRDYPVLAPRGQAQSFEGLPAGAPRNVVALVRRTKAFGVRDLVKVNGWAALEMLRFDPERTYRRFDRMTARQYLDSLRFPPEARRMLFDVFSHSFFNPEEEMSAAELLMMFHFYFMGNAEGLVFDVLDDDFDRALWRPFRAYLESLGVRILLEREALSIARRGRGRWSVRHAAAGTNDGAFEATEESDAEAVVLAVTVPALQRLVASSGELGDSAWREKVASLRLTRPFAVWRMWLDRPTAGGRQPFVGTAGYGVLDNISLYHLFENESRDWAERTGGSVVELHAYAVSPGVAEEELRSGMLAGLHDLYPETRAAGVVHQSFFVRRDCPAFGPRSHSRRPEVASPEPGLAIAGDLVRLDFPTALMERAVASGMLAASHVLREWDVHPEPLWSVPPRGMLA